MTILFGLVLRTIAKRLFYQSIPFARSNLSLRLIEKLEEQCVGITFVMFGDLFPYSEEFRFETIGVA